MTIDIGKGECNTGYTAALKAAGAEVHLFKTFGSYQGDWYALVTWQGETGWINGSFGSCSYCDAFEGEFGTGNTCDEHWRDAKPDSCPTCAAYQQKLAEFGRSYLETLMSQEVVERYAAKNSEWSLEDGHALDWLRANKINKEIV